MHSFLPRTASHVQAFIITLNNMLRTTVHKPYMPGAACYVQHSSLLETVRHVQHSSRLEIIRHAQHFSVPLGKLLCTSFLSIEIVRQIWHAFLLGTVGYVQDIYPGNSSPLYTGSLSLLLEETIF
jgi:hypothetical protein